MARPRLGIGEVGKVQVVDLGSGKARAKCRYKGMDGKQYYVDVTRRYKGRSLTIKHKATITDEVRAIAEERAGAQYTEITTDSDMNMILGMWWANILRRGALQPETKGHLAQGTVENYERTYNRIVKGIGHWKIKEVSKQRLATWVANEADGKPSVHKELRRILKEVFAGAMALDIVPTNLADGIGELETDKKQTTALSVEEVLQLRREVHLWEEEHVGKPNVGKGGKKTGGTRLQPYLADLIDVLLGSGWRIGEVLGLRWQDVDLEATPVTATVHGSVKSRKAKEGVHGSLVYEERAKTKTSHRTVSMPDFAADVLHRRFIEKGEHDVWVFGSSNNTPRFPSNVRTRLRRVCGESFEGLTPHTLRRTVATLIEERADLRTAAMQLGHASTQITESAYVRRSTVAPDSSAILQDAFEM